MVEYSVLTRLAGGSSPPGGTMKTKIPIKEHVDDPSLSWEERYKRLEAHHLEETEFFVKRILELEKDLEVCESSIGMWEPLV